MNNGAREFMAFAVVGLFAFAFWRNPTEDLMVGAIIAAFSTAYGFYLGGSKVGADTATKNANTLADAASKSTLVQDVHVVNDSEQPVPIVEEGKT